VIPDVVFENPDGTPVTINTDYFGVSRPMNPTPGPFENYREGPQEFKVWPIGVSSPMGSIRFGSVSSPI
jgi:hypothetical protein